MFQDLIQENQLPIYDEYANSDWYEVEAALNSFYQNLQAKTNPPPDPTKGNGSTQHISDHVPEREGSLSESAKRGKATRGTLQPESGRDESDFDPNKARTLARGKTPDMVIDVVWVARTTRPKKISRAEKIRCPWYQGDDIREQPKCPWHWKNGEERDV